MAMTLSFHENFEYAETPLISDSNSIVSEYSSVSDERIHLFADKMRVPKLANTIERARLVEMLEKMTKQFGATLVTARAETGKTALAAEFASSYGRVVWYQIDSAEADWNLFAHYFADIFEEDFEQLKDSIREVGIFTEKVLENAAQKFAEPALIVLDDFHNIFDADWFGEFFLSLLYSLTAETHLVLLSRAKPPQPLWRARSKQVLGVIDEKLLALNLEETKEIFKKSGISAKKAETAHKKSFGRISRLKKIIETN